MNRLVLILLMLTGILMVKTSKADVGSKISEELQQRTETSIANSPESNGASSDMESAKDIEDGKEASTETQAPMARKMSRHHSPEGSAAGGGLVIGGLVTAVFATVYCYIRVTRRKDGEKH